MPAGKILLLITYTVEASLPIRIMRLVSNLEFDTSICFYQHTNGSYTEDPMEDFKSRNRLLDLTQCPPNDFYDAVRNYIAKESITLVVQAGFEPMYPYFYRLKQETPNLKIIDMIFNEVGHTVSHFLFDQHIDATIVESRYMSNFVKNCSDHPDARVHIVENGVDISELKFSPERDRTLPLSIGYIGRLSPEKNPLRFIELANIIAQQDSDVKFFIFGNGPMQHEVEKLVADSPFSSRISYAGYAHPIDNALSMIDLLVVPSRFDGRPNVIMEANACGVPVIANSVGGIPEMIEEGVNGYLVDINSDGEVMQALTRFKQNDLQASVRVNSRIFSERNFDIKKMVDKYSTVFMKYCLR